MSEDCRIIGNQGGFSLLQMMEEMNRKINEQGRKIDKQSCKIDEQNRKLVKQTNM